MTPIEGSAIGIELGVGLLKRVTPKGLSWARTWLKGSEILVVGQARSGKTSFVDYLRYGTLEGLQETPISYDLTKTATFNIKMGRNSALELDVRRAVDVPGQHWPYDHACIVRARKPQALIIMTDASKPLEGGSDQAAGAWLQEFCEHLADALRKSSKLAKRLRQIIVVINKTDIVDQSEAAQRMREFRRTLVAVLGPVLGTTAKSIPILPCILVETPKGSSLVDALIRKLARSLSD
jgi:signal recognition particle receptor subunit beta